MPYCGNRPVVTKRPFELQKSFNYNVVGKKWGVPVMQFPKNRGREGCLLNRLMPRAGIGLLIQNDTERQFGQLHLAVATAPAILQEIVVVECEIGSTT